MLVQLENIPGATSSSVLPYIVHFVLYNIGFKYMAHRKLNIPKHLKDGEIFF